MSKKFFSVVIILQILILISAVLIGRSIGKSSLDADSFVDEFGPLINAMQYIKDYYRDKDEINDEKLIHGAVKGMVESLNDPYSQFLPPELYKDMLDDTSGKFGGLGIEIGMTTDGDEEEQLTVISVFEGNPAHKVGVKAGDRIVEIDKKTTTGVSLYDAKRLLRGEPGTKVEIGVDRDHVEDILDFVITREIIQVSTVKSKIIDENIGYIRITQFSDTTPKDFGKELKKLGDASVKGIIMDLRSNPGGTLNAAVDVASSFLNKGQIVVSTKSRMKEEDKEFKVSNDVYHTDLPLIVLIDRWSASGSEIVVGAIKDYKRGLIVGASESTYGKGSVQTIFPMLDGKSGLKLTVAHYYTPSGKDINKVGIAPDIKRPSLTTAEMKMYRQLDNSKDIEEFIKESGDSALKSLDNSKFDDLIEKLNKENIKLDASYIKFAIAEKTKNESDDYEYDPIIQFATNKLKNDYR